MTFLGLHWFDTLILVVYIVAVLAIGEILSRKVKGENDFFLAGRKLGKWFQFFLNFGNMTDPSAAATTASSVYKQGAGGVWLGLIPLFMTPYYWFMNVWFRRVRLTTIADLFEDRFGRRFLGSLYAVFGIFVTIISIGFGNVVGLKTLQPIMVKQESAYTPEEAQRVRDYHEFVQLRKQRAEAPLAGTTAERYEMLKGLYDRGQLQSYISHLTPIAFYVASSALVAIFIVLGGLKASAMVDGLQAVLVIVISLILIPFGLAKIGGLAGLHAKVPEHMMQIFGASGAGEYTWYSISAFLLVSFLGIHAAHGNMNISGSAKNELAARLGAVSGGFGKRFMTIGWCFCGLIAIALYGPNLSDPDQTWGLLTRTLLPVGLVGVMIIGILGGKLAYLGAVSIVTSALVVKNLYEPLWPGKSARHYMIVARATIPVVLILGIGVALYLTSAVALLKFIIALQVTWGAPIMMIFIWRRLTETAVRVQVIVTLLFIGVIPWVVSAVPSLRQSAALTEMTKERMGEARVRADAADVTAGRAAAVGTLITKPQRIEPVAVFFEEGVARVDPKDLSSPKSGVGRFNIEIYLVSRLGVDVTTLSPAVLLTLRYVVDAVLPLFLLVVVSLLTAPTDPLRVARFHARLKTPVGATPEDDVVAVAASAAKPDRFDHTKVFPRSNWEFTKWDRQDFLGFMGCCAFVGFILIFFKAVLVVGS
ncbi:sodium:solute symporter family protein [Horticoccus sp. 23ND18S-11]|uniref:sodium:solute symporter family protein n=1 Tax=Horticoccus sp. 23ND18S-11 TaxID=3391832 RepID=UPI0039C958AA